MYDNWIKLLRLYFKFKEYKLGADSLLHFALLWRENPKQYVEALIEMGSKTSLTTNINWLEKRLFDVSSVHIAISIGNPEALSCLLMADDIHKSINMKCIDTDGQSWSPLDLAIANKFKDENAKTVIIIRFIKFNFVIDGII